METLTNAGLHELLELRDRRGRETQGAFLVESEKVVEEALASRLKVRTLVGTQRYADRKGSLFSGAGARGTACQVATERQMARLSRLAQGREVCAVVEKPKGTLSDLRDKTFVAALADIADPGNLGTMIRIADWFGIGGLLLSSQTVDPYNEKVVRAAMGSLFRLPIVQSSDLVADLSALKRDGWHILAADAHGPGPADPRSGRTCLLMGSEAHGIADQYASLADATYTIPARGRAESLNVAVSFGIILSHIIR